MNEQNDLTCFLESDGRAMTFYNSLSMAERRRLHKGGVTAFREMYEQARDNAPMITDSGTGLYAGAASSNECTGAVPAGGDLTYDTWKENLSLG